MHWLDRVLPALQLPNGWLWDMIDEFIYQASTCFLCLLGLLLASLLLTMTHCLWCASQGLGPGWAQLLPSAWQVCIQPWLVLSWCNHPLAATDRLYHYLAR